MGTVFIIHFVSLCFFIGELMPLILRVVIDQLLLVPITYDFGGGIVSVCASFLCILQVGDYLLPVFL